MHTRFTQLNGELNQTIKAEQMAVEQVDKIIKAACETYQLAELDSGENDSEERIAKLVMRTIKNREGLESMGLMTNLFRVIGEVVITQYIENLVNEAVIEDAQTSE